MFFSLEKEIFGSFEVCLYINKRLLCVKGVEFMVFKDSIINKNRFIILEVREEILYRDMLK